MSGLRSVGGKAGWVGDFALAWAGVARLFALCFGTTLLCLIRSGFGSGRERGQDPSGHRRREPRERLTATPVCVPSRGGWSLVRCFEPALPAVPLAVPARPARLAIAPSRMSTAGSSLTPQAQRKSPPELPRAHHTECGCTLSTPVHSAVVSTAHTDYSLHYSH